MKEKGNGGNTWKTPDGGQHVSADARFLFVNSSPKSRPVGSDPASAPFGRRWLQSPKTPLRETSQTDQLEARRGKGLAIVSPLGGAEGEKVKGVREEIWREKEEEPAGPPIFPLLSSSSPSLPLFVPPFPHLPFSPPPPAVFLGESGRSELNRK